MPITYKITECSNPAGSVGTDYCCDRETKTGMVQLDELATDISHATTLTPTDVRHILEDFVYAMKRHANEGASIFLEELGTFTTRLKSKCFTVAQITQPKFNPSAYIQGTKTSFRACRAFKDYVREYAQYKRVPSEVLG